MVFYAVVSDEIRCVIEFFPTRWEAERRLAWVLCNEPDWRDILDVEPTSFAPARQIGRLTRNHGRTALSGR